MTVRTYYYTYDYGYVVDYKDAYTIKIDNVMFNMIIDELFCIGSKYELRAIQCDGVNLTFRTFERFIKFTPDSIAIRYFPSDTINYMSYTQFTSVEDLLK